MYSLDSQNGRIYRREVLGVTNSLVGQCRLAYLSDGFSGVGDLARYFRAESEPVAEIWTGYLRYLPLPRPHPINS